MNKLSAEKVVVNEENPEREIVEHKRGNSSIRVTYLGPKEPQPDDPDIWERIVETAIFVTEDGQQIDLRDVFGLPPDYRIVETNDARIAGSAEAIIDEKVIKLSALQVIDTKKFENMLSREDLEEQALAYLRAKWPNE